jgi:3-hydroxyisobutyrate dehydrogenase-like beta-hydroxyacid dehydrogenase
VRAASGGLDSSGILKETIMDVGFIGLGMMGIAMARNIAKAGHRVQAWNRSPADGAGLNMVKKPGDAFDAEVVFTMLSDDAAIRTVVLEGGLLERARKGAVHVVASTISVDFATELAAKHAEAGVAYLSAPVFGRPDVAAAAQLNVVVGGATPAIDKVAPLFAAIGKKTWVMGERPEHANAAKIAGNMMIGMAIEAMAEAALLVEGNGVKTQPFFDLMLESLFGCRVYQSYSPKIVHQEYAPGFKMALGLKDLRLATEAAERAGKKLPMLDTVREQMTEAVQAGLGDKDWSAVAAYLRDR